MEIIIGMYQNAAHSVLLQLVVIAVICDTVFGVLRAVKEKKFNSNFGIDGAIRKIGMILSLVFMVVADAVISINLIGFVPEEVRGFLGIESIGVAEFFALLYISYEVISIIKNMALCGLPVKSIWVKARTWLGKYTDELPAGEEESKSK